MEIDNVKEVSIEDIKKEAALDVQKKDISRRIQLIIFKLGTEEYALSIDQIKEVVLTPRIAKMPQTPSYIKGVANIRGNIIAILDLEQKFGIEQTREDALQNFSAQNSGEIKVIITRNIKDYKTSNLSIMTPETYLKSVK